MTIVEISLIISIPTIFIVLVLMYFIYIKFFSKKIRTDLKKSKRIPFKLDKLILALGGEENIVNVVATVTKIKVNVIDIKKVNINKIMKLNQKGVIQQSKSISIIFGNYAEELANQINARIE